VNHQRYRREPPFDLPQDMPWLPGVAALLRKVLERVPWMRRLWLDLRPLDPVRSIKAKLGILVIVSVSFAGAFTAIGVSTGIRARYVVLTATVLSLIVTQFLAHGMTSPLRRMTAAARATAAASAPPPRTRSASWRTRSTRWRPTWRPRTGNAAS
jgi:hypothetical protein